MKQSIIIQNSINRLTDYYILCIAENYNPDWEMPSKKYINLVRDRVLKRLKALEKEMQEDAE